jgi:hypothetical protein
MTSARRTTSRTKGEVKASRPTSSILGKNTAVLKTSVPDEVAERLERMARDLGYRDGAEFRREAFIMMAFSEEELLDLHQTRIRALGRKLAGFASGGARR